MKIRAEAAEPGVDDDRGDGGAWSESLRDAQGGLSVRPRSDARAVIGWG